MDVAELLFSYARRQRFEARIIAEELAKILTESTTGAAEAVPHKKARNPRQDMIHSDQMLSDIGVAIK